MKEFSYVMVKPGFANNKKIIDEIKRRIKAQGFSILDESFIKYTSETIDIHYAELKSRPELKDIYPGIKAYMLSDKVYGMHIEGENCIQVIREITGSTKNPNPGTIRFDIPVHFLNTQPTTPGNVIHASDSVENAKIELAIFNQLKNLDKDIHFNK